MGDSPYKIKHIYRGLIHSKEDEHLFETDDEELNSKEIEYIEDIYLLKHLGHFKSKKLVSSFCKELSSFRSKLSNTKHYIFKCDKTIITISENTEYIATATDFIKEKTEQYILSCFINNMNTFFYCEEIMYPLGENASTIKSQKDFLYELVDYSIFLIEFLDYRELKTALKTFKDLIYEFDETLSASIYISPIEHYFEVLVEESNTESVTFKDLQNVYNLYILPKRMGSLTTITDTCSNNVYVNGETGMFTGASPKNEFGEENFQIGIENDCVRYMVGDNHLNLKPSEQIKYAYPLNVFNVKAGKVYFKTLTLVYFGFAIREKNSEGVYSDFIEILNEPYRIYEIEEFPLK